MNSKPNSLQAGAPTPQQVASLLHKLASAEKTFTALGADVDPEKHITMLRQAQDFLRQIEAAQQQAEQSRIITESRLQSVWESASDGMRLTDEAGIIVAVNNAYCRLVGMKREELEGQTFIKALGAEENPEKRLLKYLDDFRNRSARKMMEKKYHFRNGKTALLEVANTFIELDGQKLLLLSVFRDVTEKRRLETQLQQSQKMDSIERMAGGIAHIYNDILTVIQSNASLLSAGKVTALQLVDASRQISAAADRAAQFNRQLLIFSSRQTVQTRTIDLNEVVQNTSQMLPRLLSDKISLEIGCAGELPLIEGDPEMLELVLTNLAIYAKNVMPNGGQISLTTASAQIDETYLSQHCDAHPGNFAVLKVSDTSSGIGADHLPYIFEPFFSTKEADHGLGLTLSIVYGIIKQHKGWITAASEVERGTVFQIYLPVSTRKTKTAEPKTVEKKLRAPSETILVVDDEPLLLELTKHFLESHGYKVFQSGSGADALKVWEMNKDKIDLLFTDIVMPGGINGRQLAEKLLADRHDLKVVYTSGYSAGILGKNFVLQEGINFLQKPYHRRQLVKMIRDALDAK